MAEGLYYLTVFAIKAVILIVALVALAAALVVSVPYVLFWPTPCGMISWQAIRTKLGRVMKTVWFVVEVAYAAIDTPA